MTGWRLSRPQVEGPPGAMGPAGMAEMSGKVTPAASDHPGLYRFSIKTGMAGKWELVLTAKVPGETAPVTGKVIYDAR